MYAVENARSPDPDFCFGYENTDTKGCYITAVKLSTGKVSIAGLGKDEVLEGIVAYDRAERNTAYLGQVNMITVSSFSGPLSAIWGFDLARVDPAVLYAKKIFEETIQGQTIPVYSMDPLLEATEKLFGTEQERHFPVISGGHLACAEKSANSIDPDTGKPTSGWVWAVLSLAIAYERKVDASLFVEDAGFYPDKFSYGKVTALPAAEVDALLFRKAHQVVYSQMLCGVNQTVAFNEIFTSWTKLRIDKDEYGTALTCAPYVTLAQRVYPKPGGAIRLVEMSLEEWEKEVLPSAPPDAQKTC